MSNKLNIYTKNSKLIFQALSINKNKFTEIYIYVGNDINKSNLFNRIKKLCEYGYIIKKNKEYYLNKDKVKKETLAKLNLLNKELEYCNEYLTL